MTSELSVNLLRLSDGTLIDPLTRKPVTSNTTTDEGSQIGDDDSIPQDPQSQESSSPLDITSPIRRSVMDITIPYGVLAFINNVIMLTIWGLPDDEIAIVCGCTPADVLSIRGNENYTQMEETLHDGLKRAFVARTSGLLSSHSINAAREVVSQLRSKSGKARLDAAKDILDRSGHRPTDHASINVNITNKNEDHLIVRVVRESDRPNIPTIDVTPRNNA